MNDSRSPRQPARPGQRTRSAGHPERPAELSGQPKPRPRSDRRRSQRRRRARFFFRVRQILMILAALAIGYFIGLQVGKASAEPSLTPTPSDPPPASSVPGTTAQPGDTTAPVIMGVNKLSLFLGSTVAYRSGILVTDDTDPAPRLSVDSSQVDLSTPGTYPVVYTAVDNAGNFASVATTITVNQPPDTYVDESIIKEKADKILAKILTDGMTPEQQVNAIYDYIESHHYYTANFDKSDYMQAAYIMMTENHGDCFGYYAISRLLLERLGLPNLTVTRQKNDVRTTNHWWNMVSLDGGQTWYHFDSTPHLTYPTRTCLITDADLEAFNELMPNYYYFDHASYPKTPTA